MRQIDGLSECQPGLFSLRVGKEPLSVSITTLFFKEKIQDRIYTDYGRELKTVPVGLLRENGTWWISSPVFLRKDKQRITWLTSIKVDAKLLQYKYPEKPYYANALAKGLGMPPIYGNLESSSTATFDKPNGLLGGFADILTDLKSAELESANVSEQLGLGKLVAFSEYIQPKLPEIVEIKKGQSIFEIRWSVSVTLTNKLTVPRIEDIKFISTKWDEDK